MNEKNIFRKIMAVFLAGITAITLIINSATSAFAAVGEQTTVYIVNFPRGGDANQSGWGNPELHFMNGMWTQALPNTSLRTVGSYSGMVSYCIEPGNGQSTGDRLTSRDENFFNEMTGNSTISGDDIRILIGRILQYGYRGGLSLTWFSQNDDDANQLAYALATQLLVWETVVGERDANFNKVSPSGANAILEYISTSHPLYSKIMASYSSIENQVKNHSKVPSFCRRSTGSAKTIELEWDGEKYTTTLTDTNNVLGNFNFSASVSGVNFSTNGNKLTISTKTAPTDPFTITASKKNAVRGGIVVWTDGKFGSHNGIQDLVTYAQEVTDPVYGYVKLKVSYGSVLIKKTSEDGKVDGIKFTIEGNGVNQTITTKADGTFQIDNLFPGVYTVTEAEYGKYEPNEVKRVTVIAGQVATVSFNNVLKRGDLKVIKSSEDNLVEGVRFHLTGTSLSGEKIDLYATTDKSGVATFKNVLISGNTPYTIEEVDTAIRYVVPENQTGPVNWKEVTTRNFTNILKKFNVTVTKSDVEKGTAQGDATLAGAVYGIYKGETLVDKYTTDENGQFTTKEYICDNDWTIREITPSEGYLLDNTKYKVGAEPELYTIEHNLTSVDTVEQVSKGNVAIIKHTDNGETKIETPEVGAKFEIYLKSAGSYENANEDERDILTCDEHGFARSKDMPYGIYTVHQTEGWEGSEKIKDFDVFISKDGETYRFLINNSIFESYIQIIKVDAETGKAIPYAGAGFKLYDPAGNQITMTFTYPTPTVVEVFYTDENGQLITPEKLEFGKGYSIVEEFAPYGYVVDRTPVYFDVTEENVSEESGLFVVKVEKKDMPQKGIISIEKTGEVFIDVNISGDEEQKIYQPVYEVRGLPGAVYSITAAEDIYTPDGTLRYSKCDAVDTVTTGEDGIGKSIELYLGRFIVKEETAPFGMVLNTEEKVVELTYAGQEVELTETSTSYINERQKAAISFAKALEIDKIYGIGTGDEIKNISFGLFATENIISANGAVIPADGLIEIITLDDEGNGYVATDLPHAKYYLKEIATDSHYLLNEEKYPVDFDYEDQTVTVKKIVAFEGEKIENFALYGSVKGVKVNGDGEGLEGAVIGIFAPDVTEYTEETALLITYSGENGEFSFGRVPKGTWYVREITPPAKYAIDETVYEVLIDENEKVIELTITDELILGDIRLTKVDADYPDNKLAGAVFEVWEDTNGNGQIDDEDTFIGTLTETSVGEYEMKELTAATYLVRETKAPEGFLLDDGTYSVTITESKVYEVENKAGVGFINNAMKGSLKIVKKSSDGKVEGFAFKVTGPNGYEMVFETDKNGEINISGLRIGEYIVSEVANAKSAAYITPADRKVTIKTGETAAIEMFNELRDTPKTGDDSHIKMWYGIAGLSLIGIGLTLTSIYLKKRKDEWD